MLDDTTLARLTSVSADQSTFVFDGSTSQLAGLSVGDIIVSGISEPHLPDGTLRRVVGVESSGGMVTVETEFTGLAQAVESGKLAATIDLVQLYDSSATKRLDVQEASGQLVFPFNDVVIYDGDKNPDTTGDQILLNGNLTMAPDVELDIDFAGLSLQKATIAVVGSYTASINIEARREATVSYEDLLLAVPFGKIVVPFGPIPVVLIPVLELRAGANGTFAAGMEADLTLDADASTGLGYANGSFGPILDVDPTGDVSVTKFPDGATAEGKVWIGGRFKIAVYGLAGIGVRSDFYGLANIDLDACPWWTLSAGVEGSADAFAEIAVEFGIFDEEIELFKWETGALSSEKVIAEADGCAPSAVQSGLDVINWAKTFGGANIDYPVTVALTETGDAVVAGSSISFSTGSLSPDAWLFKVDPLGQPLWEIAFDDLYVATDVAVVSDGFYVVAGEVTQTSEEPVYLIRLDTNGSPTWTKEITASDSLDGVALAVLPGGDVVLGGNLGDLPDDDVWVARLTSDGEPVWAYSYGSDRSEEVIDLLVDASGSIVVLAGSLYPTNVFGSYWLIKLDENGNEIFRTYIYGEHNDFGGALIELSDGYAIVGDFASDGQINRLNSDGDLLWARHYTSYTDYDKLYSAAALADNEILIAGKRGLGTDSDIWALKLSATGEIVWSRSYGGVLADNAGGYNQYASIASALAVYDDGILLAGNTQSFGAGNVDTWLLRLRTTGTVDLDDQSGASSLAITGGSGEFGHFQADIPFAAAPLTLTATDTEVVLISTSATIVDQGVP